MTTKKFEVVFPDGTSIEGDSPEVLSDETLTSDSRPVAVSMYYANYENNHQISVSLAHGGSYHYNNKVSISAPDEVWVNANFQALKDCLAKVQPQDSWVLRHPTLLLNLIALGIGCLGVLLIDAVSLILFKVFIPKDFKISAQAPEWLKALLSFPSPLMFVVSWVWRWMVGFIWGAFQVRHWLLELWPSVEFGFGSPHLQTEKVKRDRLAQVWILVILPILIALFYDLAKAHGVVKI
jgi:hypothetical protein